MVEQDEPPGLAGRGAGRAFALGRGYTVVLVNARRDLEVPLAPELGAALARRAGAASSGYETVCFVGPWPEEWLAARAALGGEITRDAPLGATGLEGEVWDAERVRRHEALVLAQAFETLGAAAVETVSGQVVGFSELWVPFGAPELAHQYDTVVARAHRGHRLSLCLKLENLASLAERSPATRRVCTYNAVGNGPMISVNEALGARLAGHEVTWQRRLDAEA
jgi:hypothetical protein